jgi:hypothetical protein
MVAITSTPPKLPPNTPQVSQPVKPDVNKMVQDLGSNGGGRLTYRSFENGKVVTEVTVEIPNQESR